MTAGPRETITIHRDQYGIAHVFAANEHDAWYGQGYVAAEDRLWQMDCDRRRATGRFAEAAGPAARFAGASSVASDVLARRLRLEDAAKADIAAMSPETLGMYEAYAAGVNAFAASAVELPLEFRLCGIGFEPWEPWHSAAVFKIRHIAMGVWQQKLAWAEVLVRTGAEAYSKLESGSPIGSTVILPPGQEFTKLIAEAADDIAAAADGLGFLASIEGGSNSWAVHGSRTRTGMPIVCNDSHRGLDVPNAYWQVHVSCPEFDAIGATFSGQPGFPHFGYNGHVAWNITHTQADYQDLYIERFHGEQYETELGLTDADIRRETVLVKGEASVDIETWATRHGPVVHGDPRSGSALTLRYTATDQACRQWEVLRPMLRATTVDELFDTQDGWVDPVNNLVAADRSGNIGYLTRGRLPVRASNAGRRLPAPGWDGAHEWTGDVPFGDLPRSVNPPAGYIATANQRVLDSDEPYISDLYAPPFRGDRLVELLGSGDILAPATVASHQADRVSLAGRAWSGLLQRNGPFEADAERARGLLGAWEANTIPESAAALLYAYFRREVTRSIVAEALGDDTTAWLFSERNPASARLLAQWLTSVVYGLDGKYRDADPNGRAWANVLPPVLERAWHSAVAAQGPDPAAWRWDRDHLLASKHALSPAHPTEAAKLDPPKVPAGGDNDTLQAAGYGWSGRADFAIIVLSVYRQVVDFATGDGSFIIPGGASGVPGSPHYADQLEHWSTHTRIPMLRDRDQVAQQAASTVTLAPS